MAVARLFPSHRQDRGLLIDVSEYIYCFICSSWCCGGTYCDSLIVNGKMGFKFAFEPEPA